MNVCKVISNLYFTDAVDFMEIERISMQDAAHENVKGPVMCRK